MAGGVNVKMGVSGVSQFKQNMNQAKAAVKTLDAQLALTEKQFKASGDAEEYMAKKTAELEAKMEAQKGIIENAEKALEQMAKNGVDRASKAYQDMYQQMLRAKADLLDTEAAMNGVADAGDAAADSITDVSNQLSSINRGVKLDNVTNGISKITSGMEAAIQKAWKLGVAIKREVLNAGNWADDLATRASYYEMTPEELQRMDKTASLIDTSVESIIGAQKKLRKGIGSKDEGAMGAFAALFGEGYDPNTVGWEQAFWDAGQAIMRFTDAEEKEVYAQKLFGRSWNELIPLFEAGRQKYEETLASWNVVPEEQIKALTEMDDQYQILQEELKAVKLTFMGELAPTVKSVMETMTGLVAKFNEYLQTEKGQQMMEALGDAVEKLFSGLANIDPDDVMKTVEDVIGGITDALQWIGDHYQDVITGIELIGAAFGLLKLGELATNAWKIVDAFKQLPGGGNGGQPPAVDPTVTPKTTAGGTGTAATAGATKAVAATGAGAYKALGISGTAAYMAIFAVTMEAWVEEEIRIAEAFKRGAETVKRTEEMTEQFKGEELFGIWDTLNSYLTVGGDQTAKQGKMDEFVKHYWAWFNDEVTDPLLTELTNGMTDEEYDKFHAAMESWQNGAAFYSDAEREAFVEPLARALEIVEQEMEQSKKVDDAGEAMKDAAGEMSKVPDKTAAALRRALDGAGVYIDGASLMAYVGAYMSDLVARFNV